MTEENIDLGKCFCGYPPILYRTTVCAKGCEFKAWVCECTHDEDQEIRPFVEHRVTVYGETKRQVCLRWNELFPIKKESN